MASSATRRLRAVDCERRDTSRSLSHRVPDTSTIGWLFLLQVISALAIAVSLNVTMSRRIAAAGSGFLMSTLAVISGRYAWTLRISRSAHDRGLVTGTIEIVGFVALAGFALRPN